MSWKEVVKRWFDVKIVSCNQTLSITDLKDELVKHKIIPPALADNRTLNYILLNQTIIGILDCVFVPRVPSDTFVYHSNAKEMIVGEMKRKNAEYISNLEKETGVDLNHFHKLWDNKMNVF